MADGGGSKALRIVGIVFAVLLGLTALCCAGSWFAGDLLLDQVRQATGYVEGSGVAAVQERLVRDFHAVTSEGVIDVEITVGDDYAVTLRADDNVLPVITSEVVDGTLVLGARHTYEARTGVHAKVVLPAIDAVTVAGVGDVTLHGARGPRLVVVTRGVGSIEADGAVDDLDVTVEGVGDARLSGVVARRVVVRTKGVGDAQVHATESLDGTIAGMGDIVYSGAPGTVTRRVDGMGEILPAE